MYERQKDIETEAVSGSEFLESTMPEQVDLLGDFNSYFDVLSALTAPVSRGREIEAIRKSRHGVIEAQRKKFESLPIDVKEDMIDAIVDMFSFDSSEAFVRKRIKDLYRLPDVGPYLQKFSREMEHFSSSEQREILSQSLEYSISDLGGLEGHLEETIRSPQEQRYGQILLALQTVHTSRLVLAMIHDARESGSEGEKRAAFLQLYVMITLARLASYLRGKISEETVYESIAVLSTMLYDEQIGLYEMKINETEG